MTAILQSDFLTKFECLGDKCPDTCCKGWNMQLDPAMLEKYQEQKPELLNAVAEDEAGHTIMRRDEKTDYCVRFEDGLCGIHKKYGSEFLGDACHFYPRVTRELGETRLQTATPSCPEVIRLALEANDPFAYREAETSRLPYSLKQYLPDELTDAQALAVHQAFITAVDDAPSAEQALLRIGSVVRSMQMLQKGSWEEAVPFYLKMADGRIPAPESLNEDPFNVVHALCGLMVATRKARTERLMETVGDMLNALGIQIDWLTSGMELSDDSLERYHALKKEWDTQYAAHYNESLKRWLQLQLAVSLFPFSGLGDDMIERITIISLRFVTFRLALMCSCGIAEDSVPQDVVVRIAQSLARVLDHLADPTFSLQVYQDAGWGSEARIAGLITL